MPDYLFEPVAATPYAKTLAMKAGFPLSAYAPGAHPYLTGADMTEIVPPPPPEPPSAPAIPAIIDHGDLDFADTIPGKSTADAAAPAEWIFMPVEAPVNYDYDVAVIGGGPAGYTAALSAAESGAKVILFEMDDIGGTDLYRGRVPAKEYLKMAEQIRDIRDAANPGQIGSE